MVLNMTLCIIMIVLGFLGHGPVYSILVTICTFVLYHFGNPLCLSDLVFINIVEAMYIFISFIETKRKEETKR